MKDSGVGMAPRTLERAFEPFFTESHPTRAGLGLAMAHGLIARHEGTITLESTLGEGTEVTIELPVHQERAVTVEHSPTP